MHPDDWLSARLSYLEESRGKTLQTLDQIIALSAPTNELKKQSVSTILARCARHVGQLIPFAAWAFFLSDQPGGRFLLARCHPRSRRQELQEVFEGLAPYGTPAWALHHPHPVVTAMPGGEDRLLLHSLATPDRIRGLFLGRLGAPLQQVPDISLAVMTLTMQITASQLESLELRHALRAQKRQLERTNQRVTTLRETVKALKKGVRKVR